MRRTISHKLRPRIGGGSLNNGKASFGLVSYKAVAIWRDRLLSEYERTGGAVASPFVPHRSGTTACQPFSSDAPQLDRPKSTALSLIR
jgi:hypothetical protein